MAGPFETFYYFSGKTCKAEGRQRGGIITFCLKYLHLSLQSCHGMLSF